MKQLIKVIKKLLIQIIIHYKIHLRLIKSVNNHPIITNFEFFLGKKEKSY